MKNNTKGWNISVSYAEWKELCLTEIPIWKMHFSKYIAARLNSQRRCVVEHMFQGPGWVYYERGSVLLSPTSINFLITLWNISGKKTLVKSTKVNFLEPYWHTLCSLKETNHYMCIKVLWLWYSTLTDMYALQKKGSNFTAFEFLQCGQTPYNSINQQKSGNNLWVVILSFGIWFGFVEFVISQVLMQKVL